MSSPAYLINGGLDDSVLVTGARNGQGGEQRAGKDLREIVDTARAIGGIMAGLHTRYNRKVVEQAAICGGFDQDLVASPDKAAAVALRIAASLDAISEETERGWSGSASSEGFLFKRVVRGVTEVHALDRSLIASVEARRLHERHAHLSQVYGTPATLRRKNEDREIHGPRTLLEIGRASCRERV